MFLLIYLTLTIVSIFVSTHLYFLYQKQKESIFQAPHKIKLFIVGLLSNLADTLGLGSFAVIVAFNKTWGFIDDKKLPGTMNAQSVLPALLQSLLFLKFIEIDLILLLVLILGACTGGFLGGYTVAKLNKQTIRLLMCIGFLGIAGLIFGHQMQILPLGGEETSLEPSSLIIGFLAMIIAGMLPSIGIGLYAPTQIILFLLKLSPFIAFPIMTTVGVLVQSSTSYAFIKSGAVGAKESIILMLSGLVGVLIAFPMIILVNPSTLKWLLFVIVLYNSYMIWKSYKEEKNISPIST